MKNQNQNFINRLNKIQQLSQQEHITPQILDQIISSEQQQQLKAKEAINKKYNPIMNTEEAIRLYTRQVSTYDLFFNAPSVDDAIKPYTMEQIHSMLLKNFTGTSIMGYQLKQSPQINQSGKSLDEKLKQRNEINTQLVAKIFSQNRYTMNQLIIHEQMMLCFTPEQIKYTMNISKYGIPVPPFDIRMPIICLYQILHMNDQLPVFVLPYLLNNRLVDMIEQIFWLVHSIIFHDQDTQIPFNQCSDVQTEEQLDIEAVPDYLSPKHKNHTVQSYLQARIADSYAAIERAWQGTGGWHKTLLQEILPYYISRCVHLTFIKLFPTYKKIFSPRFVQNIYYNMIYILTGVAPYQDFLDQTIVYYFGDKVEVNVNDFMHYIATNQKFVGEHTDSEPTILTNAFTTSYNIELNKTLYDNQQFQMNYAMSLNNIQTFSQAGEHRGSGHQRVDQLEPISRDFNLIPGLGAPQVRYAVDQQTRRNFYTGARATPGASESPGRLSPSKPPHVPIRGLSPVRSPSPGRGLSPGLGTVQTQDLQLSGSPNEIGQTFSTMKTTLGQTGVGAGKSVLAQMEDECRKVRRFQTPITDLQRLGELEKQRSMKRQHLNTQVQQSFSPRKKIIQSTAKVYELEPVLDPPTKYREMQRAILRTLGEAPQNVAGRAPDEVLNKTGNSMIQNDVVIIRLPEEFRPHSLADTKVVDYIDQNPVTNNDVVLNFQSEEFQTYVGDALKEAKGLLQTKKAPTDKIKIPKNTQIPVSTPTAFSNELMEQIGANNEPAKLSAAHITLTTVTPLMALYLQVSGAPTPNNCFNLIDIEGQIDYGTFKSTFYKDKMSRLAGVPVNRGTTSPTRNLAVIQRSRNDCWINGSGNPDVSQLQSTRDFIGEYKADKKRIEQLTQLKTNKLKEELKQIYIEKQLFLDPNLLGQAERASALAKKLGEVEETVEETIQAQQLLNKVKKDLNKKLNLVEARIKIAENDARREESRRRAFGRPEKPLSQTSNTQTRETTRETNHATREMTRTGSELK